MLSGYPKGFFVLLSFLVGLGKVALSHSSPSPLQLPLARHQLPLAAPHPSPVAELC